MDGWQTGGSAPARPMRGPSLAIRIGEAFLFLVLLTGFYVKSQQGQDQPTPYDILMVGTVGLFFLLGLRLPRGLGWPAALWGLVVIGYGIGAMDALFLDRVKPSLMVTVYLIGSFLFFASFVYADPARRLTQMFWAYTAAACVAAFLGVGGYFGVLPGSESFLVFGRATGTFNDPNVFGPFLVAPVLFLGLKLSEARSLRALWMVAPLGLLVLGLLLSFSRGAWGNLLLSGILFFVLTLATSRSPRQTFRLIGFGALAAFIMVAVVGVALSSPKVSALFSERASLTQNYDTDPQHGRFESQARAFQMALDRPFGIGPAQWAILNNLDTHNVYLHVLVAGGFLSGLAFIAFLLMTAVRGWRAISMENQFQGLLIVVYAAFIGHIAEAMIIDIDSWRHFYLLLGMLWGAVLAAERRGVARRQMTAPRAAPGISGASAAVSGFRV
ncbi:conserved hypothetical protein [Parvibaculum lavamentivorans DS-1]|uniref:O-antigen ligase-related domain-containing protein n=1 Tax=Parvibaculum lavamentivorans (strain DS-1 / DSM 13023 / NCIMB 13966) TaxID=402881 RepID=A7HXH6_PARL1|nr:O-antigen ligase family protein [Parvibaculum lavamentivorans]ABS64609.1 conserved hypothetical protein [Parvibaculum lavamentivorans DS-1]